MSESEKKVFISYRRKASAGWAHAIYTDLCAKGYDVFMDVESIDSGKFERIILNQIEAHAHFLLILTPGALDRCNEPNDWLTREIQHAIKLQRNIVPLLLERFSFADQTKALPAALAALSTYNALEIPHGYFSDGMAKLRDRFLKQPVYGIVKPTPKADRATVLDLLNASTREAAELQPLDWLSLVPNKATTSRATTPDTDGKKQRAKLTDVSDFEAAAYSDTVLGKATKPSSVGDSLFPPFLKSGILSSPWAAATNPGKAATGDYLKAGNSKLNAFAIPAMMLQKLEEFIAAGETIKQVAFGPNGSWVILRDWCGFWQQGVPEAMKKQLWDLLNESKGIPHVGLAPKDGWVILRDKPDLMFLYDDLPTSLLDKLGELYRADKQLKCVAFAANGGWIVLYGKNGFWSENIPAELLDKLHEWSELHYELKHVTFGPNSSWVLLAGDTGWWHANIPQKMAYKLREFHEAGKTIKSVAISPDSGWVILGN